MAKESESLDEMFDRIQTSIKSLKSEREEWLEKREKQPTLTQIMEAIQRLILEVSQMRAQA